MVANDTQHGDRPSAPPMPADLEQDAAAIGLVHVVRQCHQAAWLAADGHERVYRQQLGRQLHCSGMLTSDSPNIQRAAERGAALMTLALKYQQLGQNPTPSL